VAFADLPLMTMPLGVDCKGICDIGIWYLCRKDADYPGFRTQLIRSYNMSTLIATPSEVC
jgi:hypothetical protein